MQIRLGGLFSICKIGGLHTPPEKLWRILCISFKCLYLHNYLTNSTIIVHLGFLVDLNYHFEKLGQRDLNKKNYVKICKICILNF